MNVADLQKHLNDLSSFLVAAGATRPVIDQLSAVQAGLEPFANYDFAQFATFLKLAQDIAEEFQKTGQVPIPAQKAKRGGGTRKPAVPKLSVEVARAKIREHYDQSPTPHFSRERMEADLLAINVLSVADLKTVAAEVDSASAVKNARAKKKILEIIRTAILDRNGNAQRVTQ